MRSDEQLVRAALAGAPEAFAPILERYQDAVFGVALARLKDFHDAQDVAQDVFVQAFERLASLRDPSRLGAWLRTIAIHRAIDRLRRKRGGADLDRATQVASEAHYRDEARRTKLREEVLAAIGGLSQPQQETVALFYVNGYSVAEVAAIQEAPVGTVKRRLHDARVKLKEVMIGMVDNVLKAEAPKEDFAQRVFDLVSQHRRTDFATPWQDIQDELRRIGVKGVEGFVKAMRSPHSGTRRFAAASLPNVHAAAVPSALGLRETLVGLLKRAATDPSKKVRKQAAALLALDVDEERKAREFVPLLLPHLTDPSWRVRWRAAFALCGEWAAHVPLETAAYALSVERDLRARRMMERLVRNIVHHRGKNSAAGDRAHL